jgi:hypothetical protein
MKVAARPLPKAHFVYDFLTLMSTDNSASYQGFSQTKSLPLPLDNSIPAVFLPFSLSVVLSFAPCVDINLLREHH